jgi:hypothetical protein
MPDRREFLGTIAAASLGATIAPGHATAAPAAPQGEKWDLTWLDKFSGKHRQVFDVGPLNGEMSPFLPISNWFNAHRDVLGLESPQVNAIAGIHGSSFPCNAVDAMWAKYPIGELWKINDPRTGTWSKRNIFADPAPDSPGYNWSVPVLQKRGLVLWQCNNALRGAAGRIAGAVKGNADDIYKELRASGLRPGVILVPAHVMLIGLAQDHGFRYEIL